MERRIGLEEGMEQSWLNVIISYDTDIWCILIQMYRAYKVTISLKYLLFSQYS